MDFAKIVDAYRWTGDSGSKKHRSSIDSAPDELPLEAAPVSDTVGVDNSASVGEVSDYNPAISPCVTDEKPLASSSVGIELQFENNSRQANGMLDRAKARYESSLSANWYAPRLKSVYTRTVRRKSGNNACISHGEIPHPLDGYCSSSEGQVTQPYSPSCKIGQKDSVKTTKKKKVWQVVNEVPLKKRKIAQVRSRCDSDDTACDVGLNDDRTSCLPTASSTFNRQMISRSHVYHAGTRKPALRGRKRSIAGSRNSNTQSAVSHTEATSRFFPPVPALFPEKREIEICRSQVYHAGTRKPALKGRKRCITSSRNRNTQSALSHTEATSRFFPPVPALIAENSEVERKRNFKTTDGVIDKPLDECRAMRKTRSKIRAEMGVKRRNDLAKTRMVRVSSAECSFGNLPTFNEPANLKIVARQEPDICEWASESPVSDISSDRVSKKMRRGSSCMKVDENALGLREILNKDWIPPVSVHALIQEELYKDPWKVLVACMLLNKTSGTQMRRVIWELFELCPTPEVAVAIRTQKIEEVIRPLGLQRKRACMIQKFSCDYLGKDWSNVGELHGIGKYATDAYAIFCEGRWREVQPQDHKLVDYWQYLHATDGLGYAFSDDRSKGNVIMS